MTPTEPSRADMRALAEIILSGKSISVQALEHRGVADAEALVEWASATGLIEHEEEQWNR
ncbi:MAG TPA: hypothetical protein VKB57_02575 [Acidimicrobiales bacterium]|nr:hypothetical protein [Acidimicrobiales bacterium]